MSSLPGLVATAERQHRAEGWLVLPTLRGTVEHGPYPRVRIGSLDALSSGQLCPHGSDVLRNAD